MFILKILLVIFILILGKIVLNLEKAKSVLISERADNLIITDRMISSLATSKIYLFIGIVPTIGIIYFIAYNSLFTANELKVLVTSIILINLGEFIGCSQRNKLPFITLGILISKIIIEIKYYWYMIFLYGFLLGILVMRGN